MQCPICKQELKEDSKFCGRCGNEVPCCPTCGNVIKMRMRFCIHDGTPLPEELVAKLPEVLRETPVKKKRRWVPVVLVILGLCAAGAMVAVLRPVLHMTKDSETDTHQKTEETSMIEEVIETIQEPADEMQINIDDISVGDTHIFGTYEQDNDLSNGQEEIEWIVLDKEDGKLFVISKYALDCQSYNTEDVEVTWETCTLRQWLNEEFFYSAFSSEEQNMILEVEVTADENPYYDTDPGNHTMDRVFLLSILEAEDYLYSIEADMCQPTAYAVAQGAGMAEFSNYEGNGYGNSYIGNCWYWLRSPGCSRSRAADVFYDGRIDDFGDVGESGSPVISDNTAIRPAIWIDPEH